MAATSCPGHTPERSERAGSSANHPKPIKLFSDLRRSNRMMCCGCACLLKAFLIRKRSEEREHIRESSAPS